LVLNRGQSFMQNPRGSDIQEFIEAYHDSSM